MFIVTGSRHAHRLTVDQLWNGLLRKAEDPVPFVPAITRCRVLERGDGYLIREIVLRGALVHERVTFDPRRAVLFKRLSGPVWGTILNLIEEDPRGGHRIRFTFRLEHEGLGHATVEEKEYAAAMERSYLRAIETTLATTWRMARAG